MKDLSTGSAGIVSVVLYVVGAIIALSLTSGYELLQAILLSEILAKFSMVLMAGIGNSATVGSNSPFMQIMKDKRRLAVAGVITIIPLVVIGGTVGLILFGASIGITLFLIGLSTRSFGGITGDVLGATNELTRLSSLLIFVSL
jgi:adenosylcobinamide-GDP ribazoletransferase